MYCMSREEPTDSYRDGKNKRICEYCRTKEKGPVAGARHTRRSMCTRKVILTWCVPLFKAKISQEIGGTNGSIEKPDAGKFYDDQ